MCYFFNRICLWVATEIITCANIKRRRALVKRFIMMARECYTLNNFSGTMALLLGLQNYGVGRLKETWKLIDSKTLTFFDTLIQIFSIQDNYRQYRNLLKQNPTYIPYIGLFLADLTFTKDGGGNTIQIDEETVHIGWEKYQKLSGFFVQFETLQSSNLTDEIIPDMYYQSFLASELYTLPEEELFKQSKVLESSLHT